MLDEITHQSPNFNRCTVEVWEWISDVVLHFIGHVITYITFHIFDMYPQEACFIVIFGMSSRFVWGKIMIHVLVEYRRHTLSAHLVTSSRPWVVNSLYTGIYGFHNTVCWMQFLSMSFKLNWYWWLEVYLRWWLHTEQASSHFLSQVHWRPCS